MLEQPTIILLIIIIISGLKSGQSQPTDDLVTEQPLDCNSTEKQVFKFVFANYSREVRPRRNYLDTVIVDISLSLNRVTDFIEVENTLIVSGYFHLVWKDDHLSWKALFPFSCVPSLSVRSDLIWLPDLVILNNAGTKDPFLLTASQQNLRATIYSDGGAQYDPAGSIAVTCEVDLRLFPFDQQTCKIRIESSSYPTKNQIYRINSGSFLRTDALWIDNMRWDVIKNSSKLENVYYYGYPYPYSNVVFTVLLRRKHLFYWVSIIIPSLIIAIVEVVTYSMETDEVGKFSFSVMCLLAYSVFQMMISDSMPRNASDHVPLLSLFVSLQMIYIAAIPLLGEGLVFVIIGFAKNKDNPPPSAVFKTFCAVGRFLIVYDSCRPNSLVLEPKPVTRFRRPWPISNFAIASSVGVEGVDSGGLARNYARRIYTEWMYIAKVIERVNCVVYISIVILTPIIMFGGHI